MGINGPHPLEATLFRALKQICSLDMKPARIPSSFVFSGAPNNVADPMQRCFFRQPEAGSGLLRGYFMPGHVP